MSDLPHNLRSHFWLLSNETGEVYPLGPMYGRDPEYAARKLEAERLRYAWTLLAPAMEYKERSATMRCLNAIEDAHGDLVDIEIYCSADCWREAGLGDPSGHYYPAPEKADYDQHCPRCSRVVVTAIGTPSFDGWPV